MTGGVEKVRLPEKQIITKKATIKKANGITEEHVMGLSREEF